MKMRKLTVTTNQDVHALTQNPAVILPKTYFKLEKETSSLHIENVYA